MAALIRLISPRMTSSRVSKVSDSRWRAPTRRGVSLLLGPRAKSGEQVDRYSQNDRAEDVRHERVR